MARFYFRPHERFSYEYDFYAGWLHDVRVEQILTHSAVKRLPVCTAGVGACPPEASGPPERFMDVLDRRTVFDLIEMLQDELQRDDRDGEWVRKVPDDVSCKGRSYTMARPGWSRSMATTAIGRQWIR